MSGSRRREPRDDWRLSPLSLVLASVVRALASTVDFRFHGEEEIRERERVRAPFVLAFWHRHLVLMRYAYRGHRMSVLISQSWDGELTALALERLGLHCIRGSSSRGGSRALREALRLHREGSDLGFTPDGPRGPARVAQPGVVHVAQRTGAPVIPVALAATRAKVLRSWDRMLVPLPGARVDVVFGPSMRFERSAPIEGEVARLTGTLNGLEARADELAARR